ncbi:hypothetical protein EVAR_19963_1 [Eumeta japonica]|uniref:Uncharacterized protein n=1 Tax=Eumeta variegata TaxID=151549 RepID=A0A4C1YK04_EUMVA|nr:hypothetical protein EVAR_19963_1 [Eumeta japonica]
MDDAARRRSEGRGASGALSALAPCRTTDDKHKSTLEFLSLVSATAGLGSQRPRSGTKLHRRQHVSGPRAATQTRGPRPHHAWRRSGPARRTHHAHAYQEIIFAKATTLL